MTPCSWRWCGLLSAVPTGSTIPAGTHGGGLIEGCGLGTCCPPFSGGGQRTAALGLQLTFQGHVGQAATGCGHKVGQVLVQRQLWGVLGDRGRGGSGRCDPDPARGYPGGSLPLTPPHPARGCLGEGRGGVCLGRAPLPLPAPIRIPHVLPGVGGHLEAGGGAGAAAVHVVAEAGQRQRRAQPQQLRGRQRQRVHGGPAARGSPAPSRGLLGRGVRAGLPLPACLAGGRPHCRSRHAVRRRRGGPHAGTTTPRRPRATMPGGSCPRAWCLFLAAPAAPGCQAPAPWGAAVWAAVAGPHWLCGGLRWARMRPLPPAAGGDAGLTSIQQRGLAWVAGSQKGLVLVFVARPTAPVPVFRPPGPCSAGLREPISSRSWLWSCPVRMDPGILRLLSCPLPWCAEPPAVAVVRGRVPSGAVWITRPAGPVAFPSWTPPPPLGGAHGLKMPRSPWRKWKLLLILQ